MKPVVYNSIRNVVQISHKESCVNRDKLEKEYKKRFNENPEAYESWKTYSQNFSFQEKLFEGPCCLINEGTHKSSKSKLYEKGINFFELFHEFNLSIKETEDYHHRFLEGVYIVDNNGLNEIYFITGS